MFACLKIFISGKKFHAKERYSFKRPSATSYTYPPLFRTTIRADARITAYAGSCKP